MNAAQSKELTAFYVAYAAWLAAGAPESQPFLRGWGLCTNCRRWYLRQHTPMRCPLPEMKAQFAAAGLSTMYPFGEGQFDYHIYRGTMHLDPGRIAWVRAHLEAA